MFISAGGLFPHTSPTLLLSERQVSAGGTGPPRWIQNRSLFQRVPVDQTLPVFRPVVATIEEPRPMSRTPHTAKTRVNAAKSAPPPLLTTCVRFRSDCWRLAHINLISTSES